MFEYKHLIFDYLTSLGLSAGMAKYVSLGIELIALIILIVIIDIVIKRVLIRGINVVAQRSKTKLDDFIVENNVPKYISRIIPVVIIFEFLPVIFTDFKYLGNLAHKTVEVYTILLVIWIVRSLLNSFKSYFRTLESMKDKPVDSYIQVFMIFAWIIGAVTSLAVITGTPIWKFFTAMGAASAVIILVFQDSIKGFVASIQVSINDMVHIGDWITFEKYGADGDVIEINLATVKVQNFDKTITTIPTYAMISDAFQNWRGMQESDGRRIKRSVHIKQDSIKFLTDEDVEKLKGISIIKPYLEKKQKDIDTYNTKHEVDKITMINGRNLTNFGVFRKYLEEYLQHHSGINEKMMIMVRHMPPSEMGIPLQLYCFTVDKRWKNYEYIMADVFDHAIAAVQYFDLEVFELPDGKAFSKL